MRSPTGSELRPQVTRRPRRRLAAPLAAAGALVAAGLVTSCGGGPGAGDERAGGPATTGTTAVRAQGTSDSQCEHADRRMSTISPNTVEATLRCLHDEERVRRGLPLLQESSILARLGEGKAADMVRNDYFAHDSPDGTTLRDRVRETSFAEGKYLVGENLARSGTSETPRELFDQWLASPSHRRNVLERRFRMVGVGVRRDGRRVLMAVEFGTRW